MFRNPLTDAIVVLVVVLLIFGPKRLPDLGRSLGQGMREFKDSITGKSGEETPSEDVPQITQGAQGVSTAPLNGEQRQPDAAPSERRS